MGVYARYILPRLIDLVMRKESDSVYKGIAEKRGGPR
jgi:hypothetical protein